MTHQTLPAARAGLPLLVLLLAALGLAGCGNSSGPAEDGAAARPSGSVGILLTDAPADPALFAAINITIESIQLIGDDEKVAIYSGPPVTHDLLQLTHESVAFGFHRDVPAGEYCKIRLKLSDVELVLADDTPDDPHDNETHHPKLPGKGKLDLLARDCFELLPGGVLTLQIDMDAGKSIHVKHNKKGFKFRPVVFVDVVETDFAARLLRLDGTVAAVDAARGTLLLCDALPVFHRPSKSCARLLFGDDAAFFDNETQGGAPRPLAELLDEGQVGKALTVVGRPRYGERESPLADEIPEREWPEDDDECRLWEVGVPAAAQDEPIDCDELPKKLPAGTVLVTHDGPRPDPWLPLLGVDVVAAELGEFLRVGGNVLADAEPDGFDLDLDHGGGIVSDAPLAVMLQADGVDFNGTRIVSRDGELLDFTALTAAQGVQVDGVLELPGGGMDALLKAALVIVNPLESEDTRAVTGTVLAVTAGGFDLDPDADSVCGAITDELAVELTDDAEIFTVTITDSGSEVAPGGALAAGQSVGISGVCEGDGYLADNLVIVDDQRP